MSQKTVPRARTGPGELHDWVLDLDSMKDRMAACLQYEQQVVKQGVRAEALRALHYLFATRADMERADFKAMLGLLETDSPYGKLRLGVPLHALRFYFPNLWPEAEAGAG